MESTVHVVLKITYVTKRGQNIYQYNIANHNTFLYTELNGIFSLQYEIDK